MMLDRPHHDPSEGWVSNPTPDLGDTVEVAVDVPQEAGFDRLLLRTMHDGEAIWLEGASEAGDHGATWRFELPMHNPTMNYRIWCDGSAGPHWLTGIGLLAHDPIDRFDFRLTTDGGTPRWVPETVWYQIFPDRFATSGEHLGALPDWAWHSGWDDPVARGPDGMTQVYGGDLDGIAARLDHLVDLGVGGIYLTPVFPARSNHRYDATSFEHVDPLLGGDAALVRLREACDRAGLRLISDLTLNHSGNHHEWFLAAQADAASEEAGFYTFIDHPHQYEAWLSIPTLPKLDHSSVEMRRRFYEGADSVFGRFLAPPFGLDGWRIDVANMTGRLGAVDQNAMVRRAARRTLEEVDPSSWLVGEHFFDATADLGDTGWHGVMNYAGVARPVSSWLGDFSFLSAMMPGPGQDRRDGVAVARAMDEVRAAVPWQHVLGSMSLLGSHDTSRWRTMARTDDLARVGAGLAMALPGSPCFFYGDEVGLGGAGNEQARTPMPWNRATWDTTFLDWYRSMARFRSSSSALAHGGFRWVEQHPDALAFIRQSADERVLVRATRGAVPALAIPLHLVGEPELIVGDDTARVSGGQLLVEADGPSFSIWRL